MTRLTISILLLTMIATGCNEASATEPKGAEPPQRPTYSNGLIAFSDAPESPAGPNMEKAHLFTITLDGKNRKQLTSGTGGYIAPAFSPDGLKIACTRIVNNQPELWSMAADGSGAKRIAAAFMPGFIPGFMPAWSPDGQWLAFWNEAEKGRHVYTAKADGSVAVQVTQKGYNRLCRKPAQPRESWRCG